MDGLIGSWTEHTACLPPLARHTSLLGHELYKTLAVGRGALVLLAALALAALLAQSPGLGTSDPVEVNLESYYRQSQGPVGQETQDYLAKRRSCLAEQQAQWDALQERYETGEAYDGVTKSAPCKLETSKPRPKLWSSTRPMWKLCPPNPAATCCLTGFTGSF